MMSISTVNPTDILEHAQQFGGSFVYCEFFLFWSTSYLVGYYLDGVEGTQFKDFRNIELLLDQLLELITVEIT